MPGLNNILCTKNLYLFYVMKKMKYIKTIKKSVQTIMPFVVIIGLLLIFLQQKSFGYAVTKSSDQHADLLQCVVNKNKSCAEQALSHGASPDAQTKEGTTILMAAIKLYYDDNIVDLLIDNSTDLSKENLYGVTALMLAADDNRLSTVKRLLDKGAKVNKKGTTALALAMKKNYFDIVSELINRGATYGVEQIRLFYNLQLFVDAYGGRSSKFRDILKKSEGHCAGLTKIWLYSKWASENNLGKYTNKWFLGTAKAIADWDGKSPLNNNVIQDINEFLSIVTFFQNSDYADLTIPQTDFKSSLIHSPLPLPIGNNELDEEYTIASTITVEKLKSLLDKIVYSNKLVSIYSLEPTSHAVALYKVDSRYYYYDPDMPEGEIITTSTEKVAQMIFESYHCNKINFPAIGFAIYDFNDSNSSCLAAGPIFFHSWDLLAFNEKNSYKSFVGYTGQENVLTELSPFVNETALFPAALIGCSSSAKYFLHKNASVNAVLKKNIATPLTLALEQRHFDLARDLVNENADLNFQNADGKTALMIALSSKNPGSAEMLLDKGADPNLQTIDGATALMIAAQEGYLDVVKKILEKSPDPKLLLNMVLKTNGSTALMLALSLKHPDIAMELLDRGADPNLQNTYGASALMIAVENGDLVAVKKTLAKSTDSKKLLDMVTKTNGLTALMIALSSKRPDIVMELLDRGADPNLRRTTDGATPLMIAAELGYQDVVKKLIANAADLNLLLKIDNSTALILALDSGHTDIAIDLLNGGAKTDLQRKDGASALMIAAQEGHIDVVKKLLEKCADFNLTATINGVPTTALMLASRRKHSAIVTLLRNAVRC